MAQAIVRTNWQWTPLPEQKLLHLCITQDGNVVIDYYVTPKVFRKWMQVAASAGLFTGE